MEKNNTEPGLVDDQSNCSHDWKRKSILIIDRDEINQTLMTLFFRNKKARLIFEENTKKALDLIRCGSPIDIILIELNASPISGLDMIHHIRDMQSNIPIIVQTTSCLQREEEQCFSAGCNEFVEKPINFNQLIGLIDFHLKHKK